MMRLNRAVIPSLVGISVSLILYSYGNHGTGGEQATRNAPAPVATQGMDWTVRVDPIEPPAAKVYYEMNQKNRIRTLFVADHLVASTRRFRVTLQLPEGGRRIPSPADRYGEPDTGRWFHDALTWSARAGRPQLPQPRRPPRRPPWGHQGPRRPPRLRRWNPSAVLGR